MFLWTWCWGFFSFIFTRLKYCLVLVTILKRLHFVFIDMFLVVAAVDSGFLGWRLCRWFSRWFWGAALTRRDLNVHEERRGRKAGAVHLQQSDVTVTCVCPVPPPGASVILYDSRKLQIIFFVLLSIDLYCTYTNKWFKRKFLFWHTWDEWSWWLCSQEMKAPLTSVKMFYDVKIWNMQSYCCCPSAVECIEVYKYKLGSNETESVL